MTRVPALMALSTDSLRYQMTIQGIEPVEIGCELPFDLRVLGDVNYGQRLRGRPELTLEELYAVLERDAARNPDGYTPAGYVARRGRWPGTY